LGGLGKKLAVRQTGGAGIEANVLGNRSLNQTNKEDSGKSPQSAGPGAS